MRRDGRYAHQWKHKPDMPFDCGGKGAIVALAYVHKDIFWPRIYTHHIYCTYMYISCHVVRVCGAYPTVNDDVYCPHPLRHPFNHGVHVPNIARFARSLI